MDIKTVLRNTVGVRPSYIRAIGVDKATCLVYKEWLSALLRERSVPELFVHREDLTDAECAVLMHESPSTLAKDFTFVTVIRIAKMESRYVSLRLKEPWTRSHDLGYLELIRYVSETNYRNIWKEANSSISKTADKQDENFVKLKPFKDYNSAVREIISRLYGCPIIKTSGDGPEENPESEEEQAPLHPHLVPALCALETPAEFLLFLEFREYSIEHCGMFSTSALVGSRLLFVVYQLLRVLRYLHDLGLPVGPLTLADLSLDHRFWLQVTPPWWLALQADSWEESSLTGQLPARSAGSRRVSRMTAVPSTSAQEEIVVQQPLPPLNELVDSWVRGKMSNFDYLMALNQLCGRTGANPQHHPVLPWVRDLSQVEGGWRDLSRSKLRLTRGDDQLDATYNSATQTQSGSQPQGYLPVDRMVQVPHHLSELLADITYYVYFARRLPRSILCKHVRQKWVAAEYPASIQRLQAWTVDECIPEFFTDPTIFESIHDDLDDLEVPVWCSGPEDFVRKHMAMLESERVSEHLHQWIDITFGYKLTGPAALKSKNVCRPLVDGHTSLHSCGMVQLFTAPHPHRAASSLYLSRCSAPKTFRLQHSSGTALGSPQSRPPSGSVSSRRKSRQDTLDKELSLPPEAKDSAEDESTTEAPQNKRKSSTIVKSRSVGQQLASTSGGTVPAETQVIVLPKDYTPLSKLQQLESLCTFCLHHPPHRLPPSVSLASTSQSGDDEQDGSFPRHRSQTSHAADMYLLGCLLVEMSIFSTTAPHGSRNLAERYVHALQVLRIQSSKLPKSLQNAVQVLLQTEKPVTVPPAKGGGSGWRVEWRYPCVCDGGLPPPSAHQLLQPLLSTIPFPTYYPALYDFLAKLDSQPTAPEKVYFVARELPQLLSQLSQVDLDLVMNHLSDLFSNPDSSLLAVWQLFDLVGLALGPKVLAERLLTVLIGLMSTDQPTVRHFRLFHRSFLLKLQVRLGMRTFLHCFVTLLVEAVGGYRDTSTTQMGEMPGVVRKGSHLDNAELDPLHQTSTASREASPMRGPHGSSSSERDALPSASPEPATFGEPEMFELDQDQELEQSSSSYTFERKETGTFPGGATWSPSGDKDEQLSATSHLDQPESETTDPSSQVPAVSSIPVTETYEITAQDTSSESGGGGCSLSDIASESVVWLAHRLGPVLTAKHLSRNLLRMLTLCYLGPQQLSPAKGALLEGDVSLFEQGVVGDQTAAKVLETLANLAMLYGESFITRQYLPHAVELLCMCKKHLTETLEAGLIGAITMVKHVLPFLSDTTLMSQLQEVVLKNILYPLVQLASSIQHCFPRGVASRQVLTRKIADTLYLVGLRIGFQMSRRHLSVLLRRFFASFNRAFPPGDIADVQHLTPLPSAADKEELCRSAEEYLPIKREADSQELKIGTPVKLSSVLQFRGSPPYPPTPPFEEKEGDDRNIPERALQEVKEVFTAELAFMTYIPLCKLAGGIYMEQTLNNHELILELCAVHDSALAMGEPGSDASSGSRKFRKGHYRMPSAGQDESIVSGEFGKNVAMVGNRIDVQLGEESHLVPAGELPDAAPKYDINLLMRKMTNGQRHLKGSWLAYWEHEIGCGVVKDGHFDFKQIRLQTFTGHTGSVRSLEALENENSFLSGSKDRTVKLWSLRSCGDGSTVVAPQWTYPHHRKSVASVAFLPSLRLVGSSDHGVHIWDPFMGSCLKQFDSSKTQPVTVLLAMPSPSTTFLAATSNSTVRFLDARTMRYTHELRVSIGSAGLIRSLAVGPSGNWLAVGHSSGVMSVLDVRTGFMLGSWVAHDGEILQTKAFNDTYFISSSLDHSISVWNAAETKLHYHLKGATEPVTCLGLHNAGVVSGTTANKINVHTTIDEKGMFTSTKLRSETFRGVIASMAVLPLNRLLLLGADNGGISLLC